MGKVDYLPIIQTTCDDYAFQPWGHQHTNNTDRGLGDWEGGGRQRWVTDTWSINTCPKAMLEASPRLSGAIATREDWPISTGEVTPWPQAFLCRGGERTVQAERRVKAKTWRFYNNTWNVDFLAFEFPSRNFLVFLWTSALCFPLLSRNLISN